MWQPLRLASRPHSISFFKPNYSWSVIHLVVFFLISDQGHNTFLYGHTKHNRECRGKEQTNKHGLGLAQSTERRSLCDTFVQLSVHLQAITGVYFAQNLHKATRNADSSLDCPASILSQPPSADCVLLWTSISSRLFSSSLLCQLTPSVFPGTFLPSPTTGLAHRPFVWVSRQNRQRDPLSGTNTNGNEMLHIVSQV